MIEVEPIPENPDMFVITKLDHSLALGQQIDIEYIKNKLGPIYGDSLNLVDPGRMKRLCPPIVNSPGKVRK